MGAPETSDELAYVRSCLARPDVHAALDYLNGRTAYRFTGLYRFEGGTLRNVALFDRWVPRQKKGADAPLDQTFCGIVRDAGELEVQYGPTDPRFPWMQQNAVVCYCGTLVRDGDGEPLGTLCHFDVQRCEQSSSELALLRAAAPLFAPSLHPDQRKLANAASA